MYYHPKGRNHFVSKSLYVFKSPKDRHHEMIVAYTEGGAVLADVTQGMSGYIWHCYLDNNNIYLKREDLDTTYLITTKENVSQLDVTFDQSMRPFICYVADDLPYYYHFNTDSNVYSEVPLDPSIKFPRCELDTRDELLKSNFIPMIDVHHSVANFYAKHNQFNVVALSHGLIENLVQTTLTNKSIPPTLKEEVAEVLLIT